MTTKLKIIVNTPVIDYSAFFALKIIETPLKSDCTLVWLRLSDTIWLCRFFGYVD